MWGLPAQVAQKSAVLEQRCGEAGRDPSTIARCAQWAVTISDDPELKAKLAGRRIIGSLAEVQDTLGAYVEAGLDEFIYPHYLGGRDAAEQREAADRFLEEAAAPFRG
jgi:alkanesulfonate monooxygenase SsuD/methylene tetrahydromethanopterin reductase-like flavin-dependent oxidoreductase (luciferase family)